MIMIWEKKACIIFVILLRHDTTRPRTPAIYTALQLTLKNYNHHTHTLRPEFWGGEMGHA